MKTKAGSLEEVILFATGNGATEKAARWFWFKNEGAGWINAGHRIKDWRATFLAWWEANYFPANCYPQAKRQAVPPWRVNKVVDTYKDQSVGGHDPVTFWNRIAQREFGLDTWEEVVQDPILGNEPF